MPQARTIFGTRIYWLTHRYPPGTEPTLSEPSETREYDPPYRVGYGRVLRIPFTLRGLVVGRWESVEDEDIAVWLALGGHELDASTEDVKGWTPSDDYERWQEREKILSSIEMGPTLHDLDQTTSEAS